MAEAAGAPPAPPPPPPPPPPNKKTSFEDLPTELLLSIVQFLYIRDYNQFALAIYPILEWHGLVPPLTLETFNRITNSLDQYPVLTLNGSVSQPVWTLLPAELLQDILEYLEPADQIAFLFSHPVLFRRYFPPLSEETRMRLWSLTQRSQKR